MKYLKSDFYKKNPILDNRIRILNPDGTYKWAWSKSFPVRDENGQIYRFVETLTDINEQVEIEVALRKSEVGQQCRGTNNGRT